MGGQTQPDWTVTQQLTSSGKTSLNGAQSMDSSDSAVDYVMLPSDYFVNITDTSAARAVTAPPAADVSGQIFEVYDGGLNALNFNITIDTIGSETFNGGASLVMAISGGTARFRSDGTNYQVLFNG